MIDTREYERYSVPLEQQMRRISLIGPRFLEAIRSADSSSTSRQLITDAVALAQELRGRPGDGGLQRLRHQSTDHARIYWSVAERERFRARSVAARRGSCAAIEAIARGASS